MATDICIWVGGRIRRLRLQRGWTQQILADHAELAREHISAIETARSEPGLRALERIAEQLLAQKQEAIAIAAVFDSVQIEKDIPLLAGLFAFQDSRESGTEITRKITRNYTKHDNPDIDVEVSGEYRSVEGLPTADDRQMYMAFVKVANESRTSHGKLQNPIDFSATSILRVLGKSESDANYEAVDKWIRRMTYVRVKYSVIITYCRSV